MGWERGEELYGHILQSQGSATVRGCSFGAQPLHVSLTELLNDCS